MISPDIFILDGEYRAALGVARSLSGKGLSITVGSKKASSMTNYSHHINNHFTYVYDTDDLEKAHSAITKQVKSKNPKVMMPIMNPGWSIIYAFYDEYKNLTRIVPNPGHNLFEKLFDKSHLAEVSKKFGVPIPKTYLPNSINDALSLIDELPFPILLKPKKGESGRGIKKINGQKDLVNALSQYEEMPIIQEFISGEDLELTLLCIQGEPIAGSVYLSLRNYPLPFGPPVACRTIRDDDLMHLGMNFLRKLNYTGVGHLDFRRDRKDGQAKLLDFNVRLAGTNDISISSGVDFAYLLYKQAIGEEVDRIFEYQIDKEFRWPWGELMHFGATTKKWQTLKDLLRWKNVSTNFLLTDPLPSIIPLLRKIVG